MFLKSDRIFDKQLLEIYISLFFAINKNVLSDENMQLPRCKNAIFFIF